MLRIVQGKKILLIEDDALIRLQISDVLLDADSTLKIIEAKDGEAGLQLLETDFPDLVLLDLFMPKLSGLETLERIRSRNPHLKVLIISSLDSDGMKQSLLSAGASGFLGKPFHPVELADTVRRYLG